ncbi:MAG: hypothetical protein MJZ68_09365, partial [archaeon]|nr:hypothetical protein [archaeon]
DINESGGEVTESTESERIQRTVRPWKPLGSTCKYRIYKDKIPNRNKFTPEGDGITSYDGSSIATTFHEIGRAWLPESMTD